MLRLCDRVLLSKFSRCKSQRLRTEIQQKSAEVFEMVTRVLPQVALASALLTSIRGWDGSRNGVDVPNLTVGYLRSGYG
jgi:hypothetical protein